MNRVASKKSSFEEAADARQRATRATDEATQVEEHINQLSAMGKNKRLRRAFLVRECVQNLDENHHFIPSLRTGGSTEGARGFDYAGALA